MSTLRHEWQTKVDHTSSDLGACQVENQNFTWDVSALMPARAKKIHGRSIPQMGPNCFATVLYVNGLIPQWTYQDSAQPFTQTCRKISFPEKLQAGDLISVRSNVETHAFTYISDELVFSKPSFEAMNPTRFLKLAADLVDFNVSAECLSTAPGFSKKRKCQTMAQVLRCQTATVFDSRLQAFADEIEQFENRVSIRVQSSEKLSLKDRSKMEELQDALLTRTIALMDAAADHPKEPKLYLHQLDQLWSRVTSLKTQISLL